MNCLAAIGFGYTAQALANRLSANEWRVTGSKRTQDGAAAIRAEGRFDAFVLDEKTTASALSEAIGDVTHILLSAAPTGDGDPVIERLAAVRSDLSRLQWIGYLSTIGVYGNHDGDWVDEETLPSPVSVRGQWRLAAERAWLAFGAAHDVDVHVFRLPGIYGPGRSAFDRLEAGKARRIIKPGQVFNRMHVDDIAGALERAMVTTSDASDVFNLTDDLPAPPQDVIAYAADLMGIEPPPEVAFDDADITAMARKFYGDNKRVSNRRMKVELGYQPTYPTYREGLQAIWKDTRR